MYSCVGAPAEMTAAAILAYSRIFLALFRRVREKTHTASRISISSSGGSSSSSSSSSSSGRGSRSSGKQQKKQKMRKQRATIYYRAVGRRHSHIPSVSVEFLIFEDEKTAPPTFDIAVLFYAALFNILDLRHRSTVLFYAALFNLLDWMRPPALKQRGLARDKLGTECALSAAPIAWIELIVQTKTTKPAGWVGRSVFFLCLLPCSRRVARLRRNDQLGRSISE